MPQKKTLWRKSLPFIFCALAGAMIGDTALTERHAPVVMFTPAIPEGEQGIAQIFESVSGQQFMEHPLWIPFSEGSLMEGQYFRDNPFNLYEVTTRGKYLSRLTGIYFVTDVRLLQVAPMP